jgi:hypothetical protein
MNRSAAEIASDDATLKLGGNDPAPLAGSTLSGSSHVRENVLDHPSIHNQPIPRQSLYSTVTLFARFRGLSTSHPNFTAV